jgi:hypothetical protein
MSTTDVDLDDLTFDELEVYDPDAAVVAGALAGWYEARCCCRHHCVGDFLKRLADEGYQVTPVSEAVSP